MWGTWGNCSKTAPRVDSLLAVVAVEEFSIASWRSFPRSTQAETGRDIERAVHFSENCTSHLRND
jgi:hypothetical protein